MLDLMGILKKRKQDWDKARIPKHVAIDMAGIVKWAGKKNIELGEADQKSFSIVNSLVDEQIRLNIPVFTFFVLSYKTRETNQFSILLSEFTKFISSEEFKNKVKENKIKITALGKWYDLPFKTVEAVKELIEETKDYDNFFLNLCLNYDGQEEIVDACKLIARQIKQDKLDADSITKEVIKENTWSSYFIPPDLVIKNGLEKKGNSFLLWDSKGAKMYFSGKLFPDFGKGDLLKGLKEYQG